MANRSQPAFTARESLLRGTVPQLARNHDTGAQGLLTDRSDLRTDDSRGVLEEIGENVGIEEIALSGYASDFHRLESGVLDVGEVVLQRVPPSKQAEKHLPLGA